MTTERAYHARLDLVNQVYAGNNGDATKALYDMLAGKGPAGEVALNLFRACKTSEAAKRYRGGNKRGSYRAQAYGRKDWSIGNLVRVLALHGRDLGIQYGWGVDRSMAEDAPHRNVFYVDIPLGQVSFHNSSRLDGPAYPGEWDGMRGLSAPRVRSWCAHLLSGYPVPAQAPPAVPVDPVDLPFVEPKQESML